MRIALISDTHLSARAPAFEANWRAAADYVAASGADLTIHLGDVTVDGYGSPEDVEHAARLCRAWPTPLRLLPGNHDIGDNPPGPAEPAKEPLSPDRLAHFRTALGADHWSFGGPGWRVIGLDAQLFATESEAEAEQWAWLEATLRQEPEARIALLLHKPLFQGGPDDAAPSIRYLPLAPRRRLLAMLARHRLGLVLSGHTHQYLDRGLDGVPHVWMPSASFFLPDTIQDRGGEKVVGLGLLDLDEKGFRLHFVCAEGMVRHDILDHPIYPEIAEARARLGLAQR
jgi:3',5'-cyclic AMP phosphodiesterase CpdA